MMFFKKKSKSKLHEFRKTALMFGHDLREYTDEELEEGLVRFYQQIPKTGVTLNQASKAFKSIVNKG